MPCVVRIHLWPDHPVGTSRFLGSPKMPKANLDRLLLFANQHLDVPLSGCKMRPAGASAEQDERIFHLSAFYTIDAGIDPGKMPASKLAVEQALRTAVLSFVPEESPSRQEVTFGFNWQGLVLRFNVSIPL